MYSKPFFTIALRQQWDNYKQKLPPIFVGIDGNFRLKKMVRGC